MSQNVNDDHGALAVLSAGYDYTLQVTIANASSNTKVVEIEIDRDVASWSVAENKQDYADMSEARRLRVMFSDGTKSFMFDRRNVRRGKNFVAWAGRLTFYGGGAVAH